MEENRPALFQFSLRRLLASAVAFTLMLAILRILPQQIVLSLVISILASWVLVFSLRVASDRRDDAPQPARPAGSKD